MPRGKLMKNTASHVHTHARCDLLPAPHRPIYPRRQLLVSLFPCANVAGGRGCKSSSIVKTLYFAQKEIENESPTIIYKLQLLPSVVVCYSANILVLQYNSATCSLINLPIYSRGNLPIWQRYSLPMHPTSHMTMYPRGNLLVFFISQVLMCPRCNLQFAPRFASINMTTRPPDNVPRLPI